MKNLLTYVAIKHIRELRRKRKFSVELVGLLTVCIIGFFSVWGFLAYYFSNIPVPLIEPAPPHIVHLRTAYYVALVTNYSWWVLLFNMTTTNWLNRLFIAQKEERTAVDKG